MKGREERRQGSAAIEAVVSLTIFIVAIMTVLSFINICRAQAAVSAALDGTAREMSQYAYFYHLCGLDELQQKTADKVKEDREKLEAIAGGTQAVYKVFDTLGSDDVSSEDITELVNGALKKPEENGPEPGTEHKITMGNAADKIEQMTNAAMSVRDPLQFMKSMVTVGLMEGSSFLRSQLIAAPLARALAEKHFQVDGMTADEYLRSLNIDGMDALNLKMSTIFAPAAPNDIHLVCYYQIRPVKFFNFEFGAVTLCKESVTRAWLGGDRVYKADDRTDDAGIWEMGSLEYGRYIADAERQKLVAQGCYDVSGSGADAYSSQSNTLYHVRSIDIYSDSYRTNSGAVKNTLYREYSKLVSVAESPKETIRVNGEDESGELPYAADGRRIHLVIVIPEGTETEAFRQGLQKFLDEVESGGSFKGSSFSYTLYHGYGPSPKDPANSASEEPEKGQAPEGGAP